MTLYQFQNSLEVFALDLANSKDAAGYAKAVIELIHDFRSEAMKQTKEDLIEDMLNFVTLMTKRSAE